MYTENDNSSAIYLRRHVYIQQCVSFWLTTFIRLNNCVYAYSTQRASMEDARVKHLSVHICLYLSYHFRWEANKVQNQYVVVTAQEYTN